MKPLLLLAISTAGLFGQELPRRVLYVTHSAGFRHSSLDLSQKTLEGIAAETGRVAVVSTEALSLLDAAGLSEFDAVFFFTSGELGLSDRQKADLLNFVRSGKGFGGVHSATDTLYSWPDYGDLIGGIFDGHPWVQEASIDVEDAQHPISRDLAPSWDLREEYYQFRGFSRDNVRVLMTLDTRTVDLSAPGVNHHRTDEDFALTWVRRYGAGRVFYTALGHFEETWLDPRFQRMLENALLWTTGLIDGDSSAPARGPVEVALPEAVAPGAALEVYGAGLTTGPPIVSRALDWEYRLGGTRVAVNGADAPLYYASPTQLNLQFPWDLPSGSMARVALTIGERTFEAGLVPVAETAPVIRAVVAQDGYLLIYATGLGLVAEPLRDGEPAPLDRLVQTQLTPQVWIAGEEASVAFSGLAPGWIALYQVNAKLPPELPSGGVEVELRIGDQGFRFLWEAGV